jgi:tRNA pseudouridine38-40 synthase
LNMQNYKLTLSYDGTDFHGWQRQPDKRTVQGILEDCLAKITQNKIHVIGAGRTDAGVHAQGQVASFKARISLDDEELFRALNSVLPQDVRVVSLIKIDPDFHARKSARSKVYQYRICNSPLISPFLIRYVLHWPSPLNAFLMKEAASLFIRQKGTEIIYTVEANGFLRYMVRTMVGTLLETGKGKVPPTQIDEIFRRKKRSLASPTAPAKGLCLVRVNY